MGMFRDMKDAFGVLRSDELKEIKRKADAQPRANMMEGIRAANEAMDYAPGMQAQYAGMTPAAGPGVYAGGIAGTATLNSLADTGVMINNAPVLEMDLMVNVPGRAPYNVKHKQVVSHAALPGFTPGRAFTVHVSAQDPNQLTLG